MRWRLLLVSLFGVVALLSAPTDVCAQKRCRVAVHGNSPSMKSVADTVVATSVPVMVAGLRAWLKRTRRCSCVDWLTVRGGILGVRCSLDAALRDPETNVNAVVAVMCRKAHVFTSACRLDMPTLVRRTRELSRRLGKGERTGASSGCA